jgi:hypothetical protein
MWLRMMRLYSVIGVARGAFLHRGVILSKIPDFRGQFLKEILVSGISRSISKIFFHCTPTPPAYAYVSIPYSGLVTSSTM